MGMITWRVMHRVRLARLPVIGGTSAGRKKAMRGMDTKTTTTKRVTMLIVTTTTMTLVRKTERMSVTQ